MTSQEYIELTCDHCQMNGWCFLVYKWHKKNMNE